MFAGICSRTVLSPDPVRPPFTVTQFAPVAVVQAQPSGAVIATSSGGVRMRQSASPILRLFDGVEPHDAARTAFLVGTAARAAVNG